VLRTEARGGIVGQNMTTSFIMNTNELDESFLKKLRSLFRGKRIEIVVHEKENDVAEEHASAQDFFEGYAEEDAMYDNYFEWRKTSDSVK
jgi:hypothetical protein